MTTNRTPYRSQTNRTDHIPVEIRTKLKRGTGTRDQDEVNIKVRGQTADEAADRLETVLERANDGQWADRLREYQPEASGDD